MSRDKTVDFAAMADDYAMIPAPPHRPYYAFANNFLNSRSHSRKPLCVSSKDLALFAGFSINPFSWGRFVVSQSKNFHARYPSCNVK